MTALKPFEACADTEIVQKILAGHIALYEILIRRYNAYLYKTARAYGFHHHDAEDLMQETYISAYAGLGKFKNLSSFKTWLVKIMLHHCYHKKQKFSFRKEIPVEDHEQEKSIPMFTHNDGDTAKHVMNKELGHVLEAAIQEIPVDYSMVFTLRELNGLSIAETSEALDISESNVKVRLNRAKHMLRSHVEKMYSPKDIFEFNLVYCDRMVQEVMGIINRQTF